jgi:tetratricopeptide (TPR) repeat protein
LFPSQLFLILSVLSSFSGGFLEKSVRYLEKVAWKALCGNANKEAISYYSELLSYVSNRQLQAGAVTTIETVTWERHLAEAYFADGSLAQSQKHLEHALSVLGFPNPVTTLHTNSGNNSGNNGGLGFSKGSSSIPFRHYLRQGWSSWIPTFSSSGSSSFSSSGSSGFSGSLEDLLSNTGSGSGSGGNGGSKTLEATLIYSLLSDIYFFESQKNALVYSAIYALSLAKEIGAVQPLVNAYSTMCYVTKWSSSLFTSLDDKYRQKALELATSVKSSSFSGVDTTEYVGTLRQDLVARAELGTALRDWILGDLGPSVSSLEAVISTFSERKVTTTTTQTVSLSLPPLNFAAASSSSSSSSGSSVSSSWSHLRCLCLWSYGTVLLSLGNIDLAREQFELCVRVSDHIQDLFLSAFARLGETSAHFLAGDTRLAKKLIEQVASHVHSKQVIYPTLFCCVCYSLAHTNTNQHTLTRSHTHSLTLSGHFFFFLGSMDLVLVSDLA